jgi:hypothetical protein
LSTDDSSGQQPSNGASDPWQQSYLPYALQQPYVPQQEPTQQYFQVPRHPYMSPQRPPSLQRYFPEPGGRTYGPPGKWHRVRNLRGNTSLIILSIAGVLVFVVAFAVGLGWSKTPAASKLSAPAIATAPNSQSGVQNATPSPPPSPSLSELEEQWAAGPAGTAAEAVASDLKSFQGDLPDVAAHNYGPVAATCQQLATDSTTALGEPANPDPNVAQHLSAAYADMQSAASACVTGVQTLDASVLQQSVNEFSQAKAQIQDVLAAIKTDCPECNLND